MSEESTAAKSYNPDVLTCIANLSNDEIFTPPKLANQILDLLPEEIWHDKTATFLDPATKTGVFLREIAARLIVGLEEEIPDLQERVNHICKNQIFGVAITDLTALISRRSLYCSKIANGQYSICTCFEGGDGNIKQERTEHTWKNGKCIFCGAPRKVYERGEELESYAYQFIHTKTPEEIFQMKFDVIVSNPPYQLQDGGAQKSAVPIYHHFIQQAKKLSPRYMTMIVPARWYAGGKGLDMFRSDMLRDKHLTIIHDFPETTDLFPKLNIRGGVCYFLWDRDNPNDLCQIYNHRSNEIVSSLERPLLEPGVETFIRYNAAIDILHKVQNLHEPTMDSRVSSRKPFGLPTDYNEYADTPSENSDVLLYRRGGIGYVQEGQLLKNHDLIDKTKVIISRASSGGDAYPHLVFSKPILARPHSACTETYLIVDVVKTEDEGRNLISYITTRFFRFLVLLLKNTQDVPKRVYSFVPIQDFSKPWTDEELYAKYGISNDDIAFIESLIKPMETT